MAQFGGIFEVGNRLSPSKMLRVFARWQGDRVLVHSRESWFFVCLDL